MQLKTNEVDRYIQNISGYHPIILVYGPDQGRVSENCTNLIKGALKGNDDPLALQTFDSDEIANDPGKLADEVFAIALFGDKRVIRVKLSGNRTITKSIETILDEPSTDTTVILEAGDLKKSNSVRSLIEKSKFATTIPCYADDIGSLNQLITQEFSTANLKISKQAQEMLASLLGENRQTTRNEIQKLILYGHQKSEITIDDVESLIGDAASALTDNTIDLAMTGETKAAMINFNRSLKMGPSSFQTAHALQRHLSVLQLLRHQITNGAQINAVIDRARPPIHFKRKASIRTQLNLWEGEDIVKAQNYLLAAIKDSRLRPLLADTVLRALLMKLCQFAARKKKRRGRA